MGRRGGAVRGCRFTEHPAPSSSNLLLPAGCSVARDRALLRTLSCMLNTPAPCRILQPSALLCCRGGGEAALAFQHSSRRMAGGGKLQDRALLPWMLSCGSVFPPDHPSSRTACAQPALLPVRVLLERNSLTPQGMCSPSPVLLPVPWVCLSLFLLPSGWNCPGAGFVDAGSLFNLQKLSLVMWDKVVSCPDQGAEATHGT